MGKTSPVARYGRVLAFAGAVLASAAGSAAAQETDLARAVKATYLYKFVPFIEWPPSSFAGSASAYQICILGEEGFGRLVARAVSGERVNGRSFAVRLLVDLDPVQLCHVIYATEGAPLSSEQVLEAVRGAPVLTVSDADRGSSGGVIHFVLVEGRVRFVIDLAQAREQGLTISSRVLELALRVEGR